MEINDKLSQFSKQDSPIDVTLSGLEIDVSCLQLKKQYLLIDVKLFDREINDRLSQFSKQYSPIDVTLFGIEIDVRLLHSLKQYSPIDVTLFGIVIVLSLSQP